MARPIGSLQFRFGVGVTGLGLATMMLSRGRYLEISQVLSAGVASTGFLIAATTPEGRGTRFGKWILAGLCCCWLGDVLGPTHFLVGTYAFMGAHVFFVLSCWQRGWAWNRIARAAIPVILVSASIATWMMPHVPSGERVAIILYTLIISLMVLAAFGAGRRLPTLIAAALLFYASDIFVALWRYGGDPVNGWFCYPLYYTACLLFAYSGFASAGGREFPV